MIISVRAPWFRLEMVKSALRGVSALKSSVSCWEFVEIVSGRVGSNQDEVTNLVGMLDESDVVIVLWNVVFGKSSLVFMKFI